MCCIPAWHMHALHCSLVYSSGGVLLLQSTRRRRPQSCHVLLRDQLSGMYPHQLLCGQTTQHLSHSNSGVTGRIQDRQVYSRAFLFSKA